jgi:hypothetical protein
MKVLLIAVVLLALAFVMIGIRMFFVKGGEFRGTCSSNNPMLQKEGVDCPVCGAKPGDECQKED